MISLVHCNRSGGLALYWQPIALRSNADSGLFGCFASFTKSPLDEHDVTASTALQTLHLRKSIALRKARAKPKSSETSALGAHRALVQLGWTKHKSLRISWRSTRDQFR